MPMFSHERVNFPAALASLCLTLNCAPAAQAQAETPQFLGHWKSDNPASTAPDAVLTIEGATVSWHPKRGAKPMCSGTFALQAEKPGTVYLDAHGRKFVAGMIGSLPTFLLKVDPGTCGGGADAWRLSFPRAYDRRHMELTEYRNGRAIAFRKMQRAD
jgi:hypothetical protein